MLKKSIFTIILIISIPTILFSQQGQKIDLYLRDGSVISGTVIEIVPNESIKIQREDGTIFFFNKKDVLKIVNKSVKPVKRSNRQNQLEKKKSSYRGTILGLGFASYSYTTSWYFYSYGEYYPNKYPWHEFSRQQLFIFYESPYIFHFGPIYNHIKAELNYGISGGTEEDWLSEYGGELISESGTTFATAIGLKIVYNIKSSPVIPFISLALQYTVLGSNGDGVGNNIDGKPTYDYEYGWTEGIIGATLAVGVDIRLGRFFIMPEYRRLLGGSNWTDWAPRDSDVEESDGPSYSAFSLSLGIGL